MEPPPPPASPSSSSAQAAIFQSSLQIFHSFPLASGLSSVSTIAKALPPIQVAPPSFFDDPEGGGDDNLRNGAHGEVVTRLMKGELREEEREECRRRLRGAGLGAAGAGTLDFGQAPPFLASDASASTTPRLNKAFLDSLVDALGIPPSFPPSSEPSTAALSLVAPASPASIQSFFASSLVQPPAPSSLASKPRVSVPTLPAPSSSSAPLPSPASVVPQALQPRAPPVAIPPSSPDPLSLPYASPQHPLNLHRKRSQVTIGNRTNSFDSDGEGYASDSTVGVGRGGGSSPLKMGDRITPPFSVGGAERSSVGVESGVKRIRIVGASGEGGSGSARSISGRGKDLIPQLSTLLSNLFTAHDSLILHSTSSTSLPPSSTADPPIFDPSTSLLSTAFLTQFLNLLSEIRRNGKSIAAWEELESFDEEDAGEVGASVDKEVTVKRVLGVLKASWEGAEGWRWKEVGKKKKGKEKVESKGKGKGKGKGSKGKVNRNGKGKKKAQNGGSEDEEDEEDEFEVRGRRRSNNSSGGGGARRSSSRISGGSGGSRSSSPLSREVDVEDAGDVDEEEERDDFDLDQDHDQDDSIQSLANALLAIRIALLILLLPSSSSSTTTSSSSSFSTLPKSLLSADFLLSVITTLTVGTEHYMIPLQQGQVQRLGGEDGRLLESFEKTTRLLIDLVAREQVGEDVGIKIATFSLGPFFVVPSSSASTAEKSKSSKSGNIVVEQGLKNFRISTMDLMGVIYERGGGEIRSWILEEVLGNIRNSEWKMRRRSDKGGFGLRNGQSINIVSALLMKLVQTCEAELTFRMRAKIVASAERARKGLDNGNELDDVEMRDVGGDDEEEEDEDTGRRKDPLMTAVSTILEPALESSMKAARTIINYLLQKSCKLGKASSTSTESEYRTIFDCLIADLLSSLHLAEFPAAEIMLTVCSKLMMTTLLDPKSTHEINALKGIALDHVGVIAARIKMDRSLVSKLEVESGDERLKTLQEVLKSNDLKDLEKISKAQKLVLSDLMKAEKGGATSKEASTFTTALFAHDLAGVYAASLELVHQHSGASLSSTEGRIVKATSDKLRFLASSIWTDDIEEDIFGPSSEGLAGTIDKLTLQLSRSQPFANLFESLLERILDASESSAVGFRTKALKAISLVVAQDPELFLKPEVQNRIRSRMLDSSPAVRDSVLELVGKYVTGRPDFAAQYLDQISERITDTGLGVRRRVVKLLKTLYTTLDDDVHRVEISRRLVWRVHDEDDGIKDLAVEAIEDLWFTQSFAKSGSRSSKSEVKNEMSNGEVLPGVVHLARIIMTVTGVFKDRPPPVEEILRAIIAKHAENGTKPPLTCLRQVTESLIDGLVEDEGSLNLVNCIKTIHVLSSADPSLLSPAKASILLPFLKSATTAEDQLVCDYLLKIFRAVCIGMPKNSSTFARELQAALLPMLNKPSPTASTSTLQEIISCFCAVVHGQTHDFATMIKAFRACAGRLQSETRKLQQEATASNVNARALPMLCYLTSLLCEHGHFDRIRVAFPETKPSIDEITPAPTSKYVFASLVTLHNSPVGPAVQNAALASLGFVFRAFPTLMLEAGSTTIMDKIFASNNLQSQLQMFRILQDFLASQDRPSVVVSKDKAKAEGVKIDELVGNVDGFADSGVASSVCQRYITQILESSLSPTNPPLQRVAVDILTTIARSGFAHPLSISPALVALTTSLDSHLNAKAYSTLALLHQKHATLLATRFTEPVKATHAYVKAMTRDGIPRGYSGDSPLSHFGRWYNLLREKRNFRLDYLKTLSRMFELEPGGACSENDVSLARFTAEALSTLDFKTQEEVMVIVSYLNAALAVSGLQVLHLLGLGIEGGAGLLGETQTPTSSPRKGGSASPMKLDNDEEEAEGTPPPEALVRQSVVCGIALLLRDHLKMLFTITDAKLQKFTLGKKSAVGDRAPTRRPEASPALGSDNYARMPFAIDPMVSPSDLIEQRSTYITMIQEDGTIGALDETEGGAEDE